MKKPKAPKASSSMSVWDNYSKRVDNYNKWKAGKAAEKKKKDAIRNKAKKY